MSDAVEVCENILALQVTSERNIWLKFEADKTRTAEKIRGWKETCTPSPNMLKTHIKCVVSV